MRKTKDSHLKSSTALEQNFRFYKSQHNGDMRLFSESVFLHMFCNGSNTQKAINRATETRKRESVATLLAKVSHKIRAFTLN